MWGVALLVPLMQELLRDIICNQRLLRAYCTDGLLTDNSKQYTVVAKVNLVALIAC